jgi:hypothetical protein
MMARLKTGQCFPNYNEMPDVAHQKVENTPMETNTRDKHYTPSKQPLVHYSTPSVHSSEGQYARLNNEPKIQ